MVERSEVLLVPDDSFERSMNALARDIPEVAEKQAVILEGGRELVDEWQVKPEFFESQPRSIFFAALAERNGRLNASGDISDAAYREKEFIANATTMLTLPYSGHKEALERVAYPGDLSDDQAIDNAYERFTNKQVTKELRDAFDNGLLDNVKQRLGINGDNEDPFELRVLNVGQNATMYGMQPTLQFGQSSLDENHPDRLAYQEDAAGFKLYKEGIERNSQEFLKATGNTSIPVAWVRAGDGQKSLNLPLPTAEKILYGSEVLNEKDDYITKDYVEEARATLEHEYTHTQGGLNVAGISFGIMAEEFRAELMAGDKMGYQDAKGLIGIDMRALTGLNFAAFMQSSEKGGSATDFYTILANSMGLQPTLEFALTVPDGYISDQRPLQKQVNEYLGGINGFEERLYNLNKAEADRRIEGWAQNTHRDNSMDDWFTMRSNVYGLKFITSKLEAAVGRKRAEYSK